MTLLILKDLKKHYAAQEVLSGATLQVDPGERVGIVGRNGQGKTTLLRIIEGLETPDWGSVSVRKGARMGHVPQRPDFAPGVTVRSHVEGGLKAVQETIAELERVSTRMGEVEGDELERLMKQHDQLSEQLEVLGGWETERRIETVLSGIGLRPELWDREARTLSGGEKSRTALAAELVAGHDLLLLDEPTNHLDLEGIEWIESWIQEQKGALVIVSHDRRLLDNAVHAIVELERGRLVRYPGNYTRYLNLKEEQYQNDLRAFEQQQDLIRKEEAFIKKHMGSQRTAEAKGRQKKLRAVERLERPFHDVRRPMIRAPKAARGGERVLHAEGLSAGYDGKVCFRNGDVRIGRGQRIGVVGRNGVGKTTLLKILAGRLAPLSGHIELGHQASGVYYDQETSDLQRDGTPYQEIRRHMPQWTDLEIRNHLARFLFRGDEVEKANSTLSGGERARVALAVLVLSEPNWMALDEPTNHLDLAGRTALEEMLGEFQGALVCISHDRAFLDGLCDHILEVTPDELVMFQGNYSEWRRSKLSEQEAAREAAEQRKKADAERRKAQEAKAAKQQAKAAKAPAKGGRIRNPYRFKKLEEEIMRLEEELEALRAAMATEEVYRDPNKLRDTQFRSAELEKELEVAYAEWETFEA